MRASLMGQGLPILVPVRRGVRIPADRRLSDKYGAYTIAETVVEKKQRIEAEKRLARLMGLKR
jgi:hypothetical protein